MALLPVLLAAVDRGSTVRLSRPAPPLPEFVGIRTLVGICAASRDQAEANGKRRVHPMRPRPAQPGLVRLDAKALWKAVDAGTFPAPVRGPEGLRWPLDAVLRWRDTYQ